MKGLFFEEGLWTRVLNTVGRGVRAGVRRPAKEETAPGGRPGRLAPEPLSREDVANNRWDRVAPAGA